MSYNYLLLTLFDLTLGSYKVLSLCLSILPDAVLAHTHIYIYIYIYIYIQHAQHTHYQIILYPSRIVIKTFFLLCRCIFIWRLPYDMTEQMCKRLMETTGSVTNSNLTNRLVYGYIYAVYIIINNNNAHLI